MGDFYREQDEIQRQFQNQADKRPFLRLTTDALTPISTTKKGEFYLT